VFHADPLQRILFGERDKSASARAQAFAEALEPTKIDWKLSPDIEQDLWEKVVFLCALASTTCLFRANVREIMAAAGGPQAMERAFAANIEIATREGRPPRPAAIEAGKKRLMDPMGNWSASMLRDLESGGSVEADHIVGWMLEKARRHGIDDAILSLAYTHLKAYEQRRAAQRLPC
jgi:2-dehydropantoate 2-reductase